MSDARRPPRAIPRAQALSNGRLATLVTELGGGATRFHEHSLTRWSPDAPRQATGPELFVRETDTGAHWPVGLLPGARVPDDYDVDLDGGRVAIRRADGCVRTTLEICVSPFEDVELRRLTLENGGGRELTLEVTTYSELVLGSGAADAAHPAFSKLFVQTSFLRQPGALLGWRRPRSPEDEPIFYFHLLRAPGDAGAAPPQLETDRMRFIGRGRTLAAPAALDAGARLSGTLGNVLDPIASLRRVVRVAPGAAVTLVAVSGVGAAADEAEAAARRYARAGMGEDAFEDAQERVRNLLADLRIPGGWAEWIPELTGDFLFGAPDAAAGERVRDVPRAAAALRELGLGIQAPLVVAGGADRGVGVAAVALASYWRRQALPVDLLVLADEPDVEALRMAAGAPSKGLGSTVVVASRELPDEVVELARATARLNVGDQPAWMEDAGWPRPAAFPGDSKAKEAQEAIEAMEAIEEAKEAKEAVEAAEAAEAAGVVESVEAARGAPAIGAHGGGGGPERLSGPLLFFNGHGGFSEDGREYVVRMPAGASGPELPPLPWTHVVANEETGFIVSERGAFHTWSANSRENRLTPWWNDPVEDPHGEAYYIRDDDTGAFWSPTPGPVPAPAAYEARWGFGYARWTAAAFGLEQELTAFVPRHGVARVTRLRIRNSGGGPRRLRLYSYAHWVLGVLPNAPLLRTSVDVETGAIFAVNPGNGEFADRVAFAAALPRDGAEVHFTADRDAFLGPGRDARRPAALASAGHLDGRVGAGLDPCAALEVSLALAPGEAAECVFLLGEAADADAARAEIRRTGAAGEVERALAEVTGFWAELVGRLRVETPSPELDLVVNGWAAYQDLCCRIWARSAYYQSGGAFGFRDQLQDAAALVYLDPALTREQILLHAAHQFVEGDVLHWWHPPLDKGIRTRFSDDLLWLPYVTGFYVATTGDAGVLDEPAPFLTARALEPDEDEAFLFPSDSGESGTVYEHCCRALDRSLTKGPHALPLIGTGDWNDGMNRVGRLGRGESVWLGFFLYAILGEFPDICESRGDAARARRYREYRGQLREALNEAGWDGEWYRRAYYDDGAPLGSASSDECRIDAIAQAWAVISGAAPPDRARLALNAMERELVREDEGLIALLTPPFDRTPHDPGYIKGYLPGVRENGGQYTHGALWAVRALADAGRSERAAALLAMLSPVSHARTPDEVQRYRVEPYVVAADIYAVAPHVGRGGWTWYTGSAGWMLRVALESVLGLTIHHGATLRLAPCIPAEWPGFTVTYRLPGEGRVYEISVVRGQAGEVSATLDRERLAVAGGAVEAPLRRDGGRHVLRVELGTG